MSKTILAGALVASVLLALPFAACADSEHGNKADSASERGHEGAAQPPASVADAWTALMAARDAIAGDVESDALGDVHAKAEPLPKLAAALLEQSGDLDAGKRARVEGAAKQVTRVADALHEAADSGDEARTRKELSRLDGLLELIRAQYPASALDADHGHEATLPRPGTPAEFTRIWSARRASWMPHRRQPFESGPSTDFASSRIASKCKPGFRLASSSRTRGPPSTRSSWRRPTESRTGYIFMSRRELPRLRRINSTNPEPTRCCARFRAIQKAEWTQSW
jgi:hypothetical protein